MQQLTQSLGREGNSRFVSSTAEIVAIQANIGAGHRMVTKLGPLCEVKLLKNGRDKLVVTEKAGVGRILPSHILILRPTGL